MVADGPFSTVATVRVVCPLHPDDGALVEFVRLANGMELVQGVAGWRSEYVSAEPVAAEANVREFPDGHPFAGARVVVGRLPVAAAVDSARPADVEHGREVFWCVRPSCKYERHWREDGEGGRVAVVGAVLDRLAADGLPLLVVTLDGPNGLPRAVVT